MRISTTQLCTLWKSTGNDIEGNPVFSEPEEFLCRWEDRAQKFQEHAGDERISTAVIYTQEHDLISIGDFAAEGGLNEVLLSTILPSQMASISADLAITEGELQALLELVPVVPGINYSEEIDRSRISIRHVRAKNKQPSVNGQESLTKIYCQ